jgi:flagellar biosynthesis protein FlhA
MNAMIAKLRSNGAGQARLMAGPILIVMVLGMMVLPLPPFLLDLLFTFNIALAIMVLLVAMFTTKALDFASFPSVLLFATLLRLSLNVASTRVVLLHGHTGPDAAGKVIEAFGHFLVGGNFAVGVVVFIILVLINFVVITKGAGRIAEVGARFTLDAMPGKQMAIDADLNAGLIAEDEARKRRKEVAQEAEFYGSMDGASKFVRGDAVAGLLIMVIGLIGGLIVGVAQHDLPLSEAARTYTLLTIGDGLVAQIPALVISTAAGVVVSRVATDQDIGQQMAGQLFSNPAVLFITAGVLTLMGLIPGMPHTAFLLLGGILGATGWSLQKRQQQAAAAQVAAVPVPSREVADAAAAEASWDDVVMVDALGLEVGYRLIPLVDHTQGGELLHRIRSLRKKFAQDVGFLPPVVHIRDNLELKPNDYRVLLSGVEIGRGEAVPGQWLAIDPGGVTSPLPGTPTTDPAFGLPAIWIDAGKRDQAQVAGYTVVDTGTVIATHLNHLMHRHGAELLGRQEVQQLLDRIAREVPKLVEDLVPKTISLSVLQKLLQGLLLEDVPIRDMRTIIDVVSEHAPRMVAAQPGIGPDPQELGAMVRRALGRAITQQYYPGEGELRVIGLDATLERVLTQALNTSGALEPGLADTVVAEAAAAVSRQEMAGDPPVLLVQQPLRAPLSRFLRHHLPQLAVMAATEVPDDRSVRFTSIVGGRPA